MAPLEPPHALDEAEHVSPTSSSQRPGPETHYDGAPLSTSTSSNTHDEKQFVVTTSASTSSLSKYHPQNWTRKMRILALAAAISTATLLIPAIAVPLSLNHRQNTVPGAPALSVDPATVNPASVDPPTTTIIANNTALRIMPLGASITFGFLSSDGNGYREDLRTLIQQGGNSDVTYVGSRNNGTMTNNAVEGWPGLRIDEVLPKAEAIVPSSLPNVILLNVGTNDCVQDYNIDSTTVQSIAAPELTADPSFTVGDRMRLLVEDLLEWSPDATVVMSTLILNKVDATNTRVNNANAKFSAVAADLQAQGRKVVLADMSAAAGGPNADTMADVTHPNDVGYSLMANRWYVALKEANDKNFITEPR